MNQKTTQLGWCDGCNPDNCSGCATPAAPCRPVAAPVGVDAENEIDLFVEAALCERLDACLAAARAAQKGSND